MNARREMLEDRLKRDEEQFRELNSFLQELRTMTAKHGTDSAQLEGDIEETEHNINYYKSEIARLKKEIGTLTEDDYPSTKVDTILPQTAKQGIGYLILASVSFAAGAILGSNLMSQGPDKDRKDAQVEREEP